MIVAPKYDEETYYISQEVRDNYQGVVELQMLSRDLLVSWAKCMSVLVMLPATHSFCLHMPFPYHDLSTWVLPGFREELDEFFHQVNRYASWHGISASILFHVTTDPRLFDDYGLDKLISGVKRDVGVVIENSFLDLAHRDLTVPASTLYLRKYDGYLGCIDVCHLEASTNFSGITPTFTEQDCKRVNYFHFSETYSRDGWKDKTTHGRKHISYSGVVRTIRYLESLGFDMSSAVLVTEITEENYVGRPDMLKELEWLWQYQREETML